MEVKTLPFRNFSENTTDEQLATDTQIGIAGAICCIIWLIVLVVQTVFAMCYSHKIWGTAIKRLAVGLTASTMLYGLVLTLHLVRYFYPKIGHFCEVVGFLAHYFVSVEILFTMCICLLMFYKILKVIHGSLSIVRVRNGALVHAVTGRLINWKLPCLLQYLSSPFS